MYTVHQEILTPVRAATEQHAGPITHYYSAVHVSVGGVELYYNTTTPEGEVRANGMAWTQRKVQHILRDGIMHEIEKHLFQINPDGSAM
jgi:hypothetical protein